MLPQAARDVPQFTLQGVFDFAEFLVLSRYWNTKHARILDALHLHQTCELQYLGLYKLTRLLWNQEGHKNIKMEPQRSRHLPLITLLITLFLSAGCSLIPRNQARPIASGENWRVRLVKYSVGSDLITKAGFEHPFQISLAKLNNILASIYIQDKNVIGKKGHQQLFPAKVRRVLLQPLHDAFQKAKPDEVIDFAFVQGKSFLWIFNHDLFTSGIFFKKNGKLNLVMRVVNFQCDSYPEALRQFVSDPTQRAITNDWAFVLRPGMTLKKRTKRGFALFQKPYFPNWVIIDLGREYRPEKRRIKHFERLMKAPPSVKENPSPVDFRPVRPEIIKPQAPKSIDNPEVRKKLQVLRELYNSGAISRSTYERKKEELLSP